MPYHILAACTENFQTLLQSKKKLDINDMRLPWEPIFKIMNKNLWLTRRQFEIP